MSEQFSLPPMKPYNRRLWDAAAEGRFEIQYCESCDEYVYPPRIACPYCSDELRWVEATGTGTVHSFTLLHHPDPPGAVLDEDTPIVGAAVELDEGPLFGTTIVDCDPNEVCIGMPVSVVFGETPSGRSVPKFTPE